MQKWSEEQIDELKRLWALGHTPMEVARRMGLTRDKVRHKSEALGLPKNLKTGQHGHGRRSNAPDRPLRLIASEGRVLAPLFISFMDLERGMCRFPVERDGQQFFCGRPQEHGTSYCDDCCRVAFLNYEQIVTRAPAQLRQPQNGRVAEPFVMPIMGGLVREVPFS